MRRMSSGIFYLMTRTQEILEGFNKVHKNKFTYPNFTSTSLQDKITIVCPEHGEFKKFGYCHLTRKQGCPKCSHIGLSKYTEEEFIGSLVKIHGYPLPFEMVSEYKGNKDDIYIKDKYGLCKTKPYNLQRGNYVSLRSAVDKTSYMVQKFIEKHDGKYTYDRYVYNGNREIGIITCKEHGDFEQMTDVHLMGSGCMQCAKDNKVSGFGRNDFIEICKDRPATLYIIKCHNSYESFMKVGITSSTVGKRFKDKTAMPYNYDILYTSVNDPATIWDMELAVKRQFKSFLYKPCTYFKGETECLSEDIPLCEIVEFINSNYF